MSAQPDAYEDVRGATSCLASFFNPKFDEGVLCVDHSVDTDPDLHELEMERIFGRSSLFGGHASQIPQEFDRFTRTMGR